MIETTLVFVSSLALTYFGMGLGASLAASRLDELDPLNPLQRLRYLVLAAFTFPWWIAHYLIEIDELRAHNGRLIEDHGKLVDRAYNAEKRLGLTGSHIQKLRIGLVRNFEKAESDENKRIISAQIVGIDMAYNAIKGLFAS